MEVFSLIDQLVSLWNHWIPLERIRLIVSCRTSFSVASSWLASASDCHCSAVQIFIRKRRRYSFITPLSWHRLNQGFRLKSLNMKSLRYTYFGNSSVWRGTLCLMCCPEAPQAVRSIGTLALVDLLMRCGHKNSSLVRTRKDWIVIDRWRFAELVWVYIDEFGIMWSLFIFLLIWTCCSNLWPEMGFAW